MEHAPYTPSVPEANELGEPSVRQHANRNPNRGVVRSVTLPKPNGVLPGVGHFPLVKAVLQGMLVNPYHGCSLLTYQYTYL